ncbi:MAG: acetyl-CoA C-acyltransferase [Cyanobacteria bacterium SZAS LIN-3]|nr:acetyl-CoA C-acyltransferase [Cyanobacteria bacterium SZAS LIN-3]
MPLKGVFILDCLRTPRARVKGDSSALSGLHPQEMLGQTLKGLVKRTKVEPQEINDAIIGCVSEVGDQGANIGRNAALTAGLPISLGAVTLNRCCASGLQAINFAAAEIACGMAELMIGGGVESMSRVKMASDGGGMDGNNVLLREKYLQVPQGISADLIATMENFSREELDAFAVASQQKAQAAQSTEKFAKSLIAVIDPATGGVLLDRDNFPRPETSLATLAALGPAFATAAAMPLDSSAGAPTLEAGVLKHFPEVSKIEHRHTAGTASGIVDGAAAVLLCSENYLKRNNLKARGRIVSYAVGGCDPVSMMVGQPDIVRKALKLADLSIADIDLFEINEAFAAIPLLVIKKLSLDPARVNVNGGAIALGHPLGATGAILVGTALDELEVRQKRYALITLCAAGGQAIATIIERLE